MALDWLYGPRMHYKTTMPGIPATEFDPLALRAVTLDIDDIVDIRKLIMRRLQPIDGVSNIMYRYQVTRAGDGREVTEAELTDLADIDREHLELRVSYDAPGRTSDFRVPFERGIEPTVQTGLIPGSNDNWPFFDLRKEVAERMLRTSAPIPQWTRIAHLVAYLPPLALAAAMIWLQTTGPSIPLAIIGWTTTISAAIGAYFLSRHIKNLYKDRHTGHRIIGQSRATTRATRANTHRDTRVAVITGLITLAVGVAVGLALAALGIKA
jgi:hypothetical protein